jgi:hypothetical protein
MVKFGHSYRMLQEINAHKIIQASKLFSDVQSDDNV